MGRAREAIKSLAELAPKTALRKTKDGQTEEIPVEELQSGDVIVIKPNSKISADGIIINGNSSIDQSSITGESVQVDKAEINDIEQIENESRTIEDQYRVIERNNNDNGSKEGIESKPKKE